MVDFQANHPGLIVVSPEAHGVIVTPLMAQLGVRLEWSWPPTSPEAVTYLISLAGRPLRPTS